MPAVGAIVETATDLGGQLTKYSLAWTSSAGGVVSGIPMAIKRGRLLQAKIVPTNGGTQPSANYGVTLLDGDGVDILFGKGATQSATASSIVVPIPTGAVAGPVIDPSQQYSLTIAAAGAAANGRVDLLVGPG